MIRVFFRNPSLRKKLILSSIACLILPALIMLYSTDLFSKRIIREHTLENSEQILKNVQVQIDRTVEEMVGVSNMIQFDPDLMAWLQSEEDPLVTKRVTTRLEQFSSGKTDMQITLLTLDGRYFSNYSYYDFKPQNFSKESWFPKLAHLATFDTLFIGVQPNPLQSQASSQPYVIMTARVLSSTSQKPFAYLIVGRTENTFSKMFGSFSGDFFLLDGEGRVLSHRDKSIIGKPIQNLTKNENFQSPEIIRVLGENQVYATLPLRYAGWKLASLAPYEQLTDRLNKTYQTSLLIQVLSVIAFLLILTYLLRRFTLPIQRLGRAAAKVEAGELGERSYVRGGDEVGQLGRAFDQMLDRIEDTLEQVKVEQELKRQAEISMLHAQIHPHFLFNILSSIRLRLLMKDDEQNAELIASLSSLLRSSFSTRQEFVPLMTEIEMARQYIELMNFTVKYPVVPLIDVDTELLMENVPRFILQPIIENAFKHGLARKSGSIAIQGSKFEKRLTISVKDHLQQRLTMNKSQIIEESAHQPFTSIGIGLTNVYDRLKLIYGKPFQMTILSEPNQGTVVILDLPIQTREENEHV